MTRWFVFTHNTDTDDINESMCIFTVDGPDDIYEIHGVMLDLPNMGTIIGIREADTLLSGVMELCSERADYYIGDGIAAETDDQLAKS